MKDLNQFDAEALRTVAYGFLAAAFFADLETALRAYYIAISVGAYAWARALLKSRKGDRS